MKNNSCFLTKNNINNAKIAMNKEKYYLLPDAYTKNFCEKIIEQIDGFSKTKGSGVEFNYGNTEMRVWSSQKRSPEIEKFFIDANKLMTSVFEKESNATTVLAIRNNALEKDDTVNMKGRWHIDSWRSQQKVFLFLNNTSAESGAFEFIPKTNKTLFRLKKALEPGFFFNYKELLKKNVTRPYQRIDDEKIDALFKHGYKATPVIVTAGTIMLVDPSYLIHRARPCYERQRYALTAYYSTGDGYKDYDV